jgi:Arc/MetJ-type ribon-helix-helix transcriptional regulator
MPRSAVPVTLSLNPDDRDRFERLVARFGGGNRSEFLRAAMDRMETAEIAAELRELRAYGLRRRRELHGTAEIDIAEHTRRILNSPKPRTATAARRTRG